MKGYSPELVQYREAIYKKYKGDLSRAISTVKKGFGIEVQRFTPHHVRGKYFEVFTSDRGRFREIMERNYAIICNQLRSGQDIRIIIDRGI